MTTKRKREADTANSETGGILDQLGILDRILLTRSRRRLGQRMIAGVWHDIADGGYGPWDGIADDEEEESKGESFQYIGTHIFLRHTWGGWPEQVGRLQSLLYFATKEEPITNTDNRKIIIFKMSDLILSIPFCTGKRRSAAVSVIHQLQDLHLDTGG